ncbi:hypothetical protein BELL_0196g00080 [Botrytis elliptica]|uniref:Uncharacterized protein n=1 Tax=Botrytis elliptica TaxID=278938 RepID=A0A4Z1JPK6_9HELO|nr:hypothetical protein EAE99_003238 [Botrytis elliptica]TGO75719.1 hypothetical protein BELL_0196g00080 [Botrytis elliptica]
MTDNLSTPAIQQYSNTKPPSNLEFGPADTIEEVKRRSGEQYIAMILGDVRFDDHSMTMMEIGILREDV